jgi:hypothetical protein
MVEETVILTKTPLDASLTPGKSVPYDEFHAAPAKRITTEDIEVHRD